MNTRTLSTRRMAIGVLLGIIGAAAKVWPQPETGALVRVPTNIVSGVDVLALPMIVFGAALFLIGLAQYALAGRRAAVVARRQ